MILYHWTHRDNVASIRRDGLSPDFCLGKKKTVWACTSGNVGWALCHVSARHGLPADEFVLLTLTIARAKLRKTRWRGVYTNDTGYLTAGIVSIRRGLLTDPEPLTAAGDKI